MKTNMPIVCAALMLALGTVVRAEDYMFQRAKAELIVEQAKGLYEDSFRKGSESYGAQYQYYFGLMYETGTNLLGRAESQTTKLRMRKYLELIEKDYEAYTKVEAAVDKAAATGGDKIYAGRHVVANGSRHRAKRMANAEKLRDSELAAAVKRWENFVRQVMKDPVKK